jgi:hypothetical protein
MIRVCGRALSTLLLNVAVGSASRAQPAPPARCDSVVDRALPAPSDRPVIVTGTYTLVLVAVSGARAGSRAEGVSRLLRAAPSDRGRRPDGTVVTRDPLTDQIQPLYGWADVTLADIGAVAWHDPRARDPVYPGVLVTVLPPSLARAARARVLLQLGSGSRDGATRIDAPTTSLYADRVDSTGMWGRWVSGGLSTTAEGYFCLRRIGP